MGNLSQWLEYLESIHPTSIDMGLARVQAVADKLKFNWDAMTVITVAGTNGKGTTCRFLEHYLHSLGKRVATYRSPHLIDYRERVTLNGAMVDEAEYVAAFAAVETARGDITLTYFEFGTLAAMMMMQTWQPDVVLLEVGLGGRLDATNIVDNDCAVVTTIGLDHQGFLGDTKEAIATEKAGVFRAQTPVVVGELDPPATLLAALDAQGHYGRRAGVDFSYSVNTDGTWSWQGQSMAFTELPAPQIPTQNISTGLAVLEALDLPLLESQVIDSCQQVTMPGRQQVLQQQPFVLVDVAHNPQAATRLNDIIGSRDVTGTTRLVVGMLNDKAIEDTLACISQPDARWYLADTQGPRGCSGAFVAAALSQQSNHQLFPSVTDAYASALADADSSDQIIVFGSFLTVADVLAYHQQVHHS